MVLYVGLKVGCCDGCDVVGWLEGRLEVEGEVEMCKIES